MKQKKSWRDKLADDKDLPKVVPITEKMSKKWGSGTVALPAPREVDALMKHVPAGKLTTVDALRQAIARKHAATIGCPLVTGIFVWVAAHAAAEDEAEGKTGVTPYWRTLKGRGELNPKYPGGVANQRARLQAEGHVVVAKGKKLVVRDYARHLAEW